MKGIIQHPTKKEIVIITLTTAIFIAITSFFIGLRNEHILMIALFALLFFSGRTTRKFAVALLPFVIFGISYDWMRIFPNYEENSIDVEGIYTLEKQLFGFDWQGNRIIPCGFFDQNNWKIADLFAGIFYLCWVPVPIVFGIWLYLKGERRLYLHYAMVFLLVSLIGFAGYYIYPAAPPWYAINYGFEPILNTPGNVAGLGRFDALTGLTLFNGMYGRNANVFAAVPSLHSAYMVVTVCYAIIARCNRFFIGLFIVIMIGIWCTAVYSSHHYLIDVFLGILCSLSGILLFEKGLMKWPAFKR